MPCLPVDSATSCSSHRPKPGSEARDHERQLVAAGPRERAERGSEPDRRGLQRGRAGVHHRGLPRPRRSRRAARARRRPSARRDDPEGRQRAVAPADVRVAEERVAEVVSSRVFQARARVGDRDEAVALGDSEKKCANRDSGSIVPPDFEETMNSVRSQIDRLLHGEDRGRVVESSTCRPGGPARGGSSDAEPPARARSRPCRAARCPDFVGATCSRELLQLAERLEHPLGDRQPAEPVGDLRCSRRRPTASGRRRAPLAHLRLARQARYCS